MKKKYFLFFSLFFVILICFNYLKFDKNNISVDVFGVENEIPYISIKYENELYSCTNEEEAKVIKNGDSITFVCKFKFYKIGFTNRTKKIRRPKFLNGATVF